MFKVEGADEPTGSIDVSALSKDEKERVAPGVDEAQKEAAEAAEKSLEDAAESPVQQAAARADEVTESETTRTRTARKAR